jgi:hypothetical protein
MNGQLFRRLVGLRAAGPQILPRCADNLQTPTNHYGCPRNGTENIHHKKIPYRFMDFSSIHPLILMSNRAIRSSITDFPDLIIFSPVPPIKFSLTFRHFKLKFNELVGDVQKVR